MIPLHVIGLGMGPRDLSTTQQDIIARADLLVGGRRHLDFFPKFTGDTRMIQGPLPPLMDELRQLAQNKHIVVLASGDPLFHGIGTTLLKHFHRAELVIHSNVNAVAAAFAAIKEPWHNARMVDLHKHRVPERGFFSLAREERVAFLTGPETGPDYIARELHRRAMEMFHFCVLEHIGHPEKERIHWMDNLEAAMEGNYASPNIVILKRKSDQSVPHGTLFGLPEEEISHTQGLITKSEVRAVSLAKLRLHPDLETLWDIGAGSGAVSVEMARLCPKATVHAVEKQPDRLENITVNAHRFQCDGIRPTPGDATTLIDQLPRPQRIFIGGGGPGLPEIIREGCRALASGGVMVINTVIIQNTQTALDALTAAGLTPEMIHLQIARSHPMPHGDRMVPLNPVWIISATKP